MRAIAALALMAVCLPIPVFGQRAPKTRTFTSSDGAFYFSYPADFQVCTGEKVDPCNQSFIPACEPDSFACVVYPAEQFKGTNFEAASFQVKEIFADHGMMTANVCVTPYPQKDSDRVSDWPSFLISAEHPVELIGGVQFLHGVGRWRCHEPFS